MDNPVLVRQVKDEHDHDLTFKAAVLAACTTQRPGVARWTELTVYRLPRFADEEPANGGYVVARVGKSTIVHRPSCPRANPRRMASVLGISEADYRSKVGCLTCNPPMEPMPADLLAERTRHSLAQARDAESLMQVLRTARPGQPLQSITGIVAEAVRQVSLADHDFAQWVLR